MAKSVTSAVIAQRKLPPSEPAISASNPATSKPNAPTREVEVHPSFCRLAKKKNLGWLIDSDSTSCDLGHLERIGFLVSQQRFCIVPLGAHSSGRFIKQSCGPGFSLLFYCMIISHFPWALPQKLHSSHYTQSCLSRKAFSLLLPHFSDIEIRNPREKKTPAIGTCIFISFESLETIKTRTHVSSPP